MRQKKDLGLANKVTRKYKDTNNTEDIAGKLYLDFSDVSKALESFKKYAETRGYNVIVEPYDHFTDRKLKEGTIKIETLKEDTCFVSHIPYCSGKFRNDKNYWTDLRIVIGYPLFVESRKGYPLWWWSAVNYKFKEYLEAKYPEVAGGSHSKEPLDIEALEYIFDFFDKSEVNESNLGLNDRIKKRHASKNIGDEIEIIGGGFSSVDEAIEFIKDYAETLGWEIYCCSGNNFSYFNQYSRRNGFIRKMKSINGYKYDLILKIVDGVNYDLDKKSMYVSMHFIENKEGRPLMIISSSDSYSLEDYPKVLSSRDIVDLFEKAEKTIKEKFVNESNLGMSSKVKKIYKDEGIDRVYSEFNEESIKEIFNKNLTYALYGTNSPKSIDSTINMFGYHCDKGDGVDNPDLNWLYGCMLYTINYKNLYIHSTILATEDVGEFVGIYIKWCAVDHLGHGEFLMTPEEIEDQELRKDIEEGIVID